MTSSRHAKYAFSLVVAGWVAAGIACLPAELVDPTPNDPDASTQPRGDGGSDAGGDAGSDPRGDAGSDAGGDAGSDAGGDAGTNPAGDAGTDAGTGGGSTLAQQFLDEHNQVRASATPTPVPALSPLTWSAAAQSVAQAWANECTWAHNQNRGALGENLYATSGTSASPAAVVSSWASEAAEYDYATNTCSGVCGHYTQIVWRDTTRVGCAMKTCTTGSPWGSTFPTWTLVVCNYDPPGNYLGEKPY